MQLFKPNYRVEECLSALRPVFESGWTGPGPNCKAFEDEWNDKMGSFHSHYVQSCTAALHLALRVTSIPKGSKVLTTPLTFISTNAVILYEGMIPVFGDVDEWNLSLDPVKAMHAIAKDGDIKAVIWVHYSGQAHPGFDQFVDFCNKRGVKIIEDCAHAAGAFYDDGERIGSRLDTVSCFSFQAVKNLPTFDGGMVVTPSEEILTRVKKLAWMGIDKDTFARTNSSNNEIYKWKYDIPELGWKYNGNDISATLARVGLKYLDHDNAYRKQLYNWYLDEFVGTDIKWCVQTGKSSHHLMVIMIPKDKRDSVISSLKANDIAPGVHYLPNNEFAPFKQFYKRGQCPVMEDVSERIVSLPNHLGITKQDVEKICRVVLDAIKS